MSSSNNMAHLAIPRNTEYCIRQNGHEFLRKAHRAGCALTHAVPGRLPMPPGNKVRSACRFRCRRASHRRVPRAAAASLPVQPARPAATQWPRAASGRGPARPALAAARHAAFLMRRPHHAFACTMRAPRAHCVMHEARRGTAWLCVGGGGVPCPSQRRQTQRPRRATSARPACQEGKPPSS